jgi:4-hydroxy-3-polyprenylbenzoate decarboxylase
LPDGFTQPKVTIPGVLAVQASKYSDGIDIKTLTESLLTQKELLDGFPVILVVDDSEFVSRTFNNFLWVTFTRTNPSHDLHGVGEFVEHKHWGCTVSLVFDARIKPHHAPPLVKDQDVETRVDSLGVKGKSLHRII